MSSPLQATLMAHWDETRDRCWVETMLKLNVPGSESAIQRFEATGDLADLAEFFECLKAGLVPGSESLEAAHSHFGKETT